MLVSTIQWSEPATRLCFFKSGFRFTTLRERYRVPMYPLPPYLHSLPVISIPTRVVHLLQLRKLHRHISPSKPIVYLWVHPWCHAFCGFGQMYIPITIISCRAFSLPGKSVLHPSIHVFLPAPPLAAIDVFAVSTYFRMSYGWNRVVL